MIRSHLALWFTGLLLGCSSAPDLASTEGGSGRGLGVTLQNGAFTYLGSGSFCTSPATIDPERVTAATKEWLEIQRDGVREGSARHTMLKNAMHDRVIAACRKAAKAQGCDLVVRAGDIADPRGLPVTDLTAAVIRSL